MSRFWQSQLTCSGEHKSCLCNRCLNQYTSEISLNKHLNYCENDCPIVNPDAAHKILSFQNYKYQGNVPSPFMSTLSQFWKKWMTPIAVKIQSTYINIFLAVLAII